MLNTNYKEWYEEYNGQFTEKNAFKEENIELVS